MGKFEERQKKLAAMMKKMDGGANDTKLATAAKASGDKAKTAIQKAQTELKTAED